MDEELVLELIEKSVNDDFMNNNEQSFTLDRKSEQNQKAEAAVDPENSRQNNAENEKSTVWGAPKAEKEGRIAADDGDHPLLKDDSPAYTASVIQRAFMSWMQLGRVNDFKSVCDYYHRLDKLESTYPVERGLESRRHEYQMIDCPPPMTDYFAQNWGHIYGLNNEKQTDEQRLRGLWTTKNVTVPQTAPIAAVTPIPMPIIPMSSIMPVHQANKEIAGRFWPA